MSSQEISPLLFFDTVNSFQRTEALKSAIELELFTAIGEGNRTAAEIAARIGARERGVRILCDYLTVIGFMTKDANAYALTPDSEMFLDRRSPAYVGGAVEFLLSPMLTEGFKTLTEAVRRGGTAISGEGSLAPEHPVWVNFARGMAPLVMMAAQMMTTLVEVEAERKFRVLDIAAGHGMFGITFAQRYPNAEIVALDWPNVLEVARENAERAGVGDRHTLLPGSAFDVDFGDGYDLVLLTNFLHHFDPPTCETLLRKVYAALKDGGRAMTLEFVPDETRVAPPIAAMFSLVMLASTPGGDAYTFSELERMFQNAGFSQSELIPLPPMPNQIVLSHK
ncbi:MAG TPA: class I SAM-dependent methyltransferase [Pyrinomonadaceae bacterium]|jgi:SAM-dependent methyltransferase